MQDSKEVPLTSAEFADLGVSHVAFVRPIEVEGRRAFRIHAADGRLIAIVDQHDDAVAAIRQQDMELVSVH